jgi:hypothetical protein
MRALKRLLLRQERLARGFAIRELYPAPAIKTHGFSNMR